MKNIITRLKEKWGIESDWQLAIVFVVFAITGSISVKVARPLLALLNISDESMSPWLYWPLRILIVLPIYQVMLIFFGTIFGQFKFFWEFEKKMLNRISGGLFFKTSKH